VSFELILSSMFLSTCCIGCNKNLIFIPLSQHNGIRNVYAERQPRAKVTFELDIIVFSNI